MKAGAKLFIPIVAQCVGISIYKSHLELGWQLSVRWSMDTWEPYHSLETLLQTSQSTVHARILQELLNVVCGREMIMHEALYYHDLLIINFCRPTIWCVWMGCTNVQNTRPWQCPLMYNVPPSLDIIVAYISPLVLCSINSTCENTFSTVYKTILSGYVASPLSNGPPWANTENSYAMRACTGIYAHDIQLRHAAKREWHAMNYNFMHYLPASLRWSLINAASTEPTTAHGDLPGIPQNLLTVRAGQTTDFCRCHQGGGPIMVKICAASGVAGVHATCLRHI